MPWLTPSKHCPAVVLLLIDDEEMQPGGISWFELVMMRDLAYMVAE